MSWDWSCCLFQSLASWYLTACWSTIIFSIFWVLGWVNLDCLMRLEMHWDSTCIPSWGCCLVSEISPSLQAKNAPQTLSVLIASRAALGFFISSGIMVWLSMKVWRACLSSPPNMSLSCFQPLWLLSVWSGSMSRASR